MTVERIIPNPSPDVNRIAQIMTLYQASVASQVEAVRQQKREVLIASVIGMILALLSEIRGKGLSSEIAIAKIYRLLEIIALLGIGDRPEIIAQVTKLKHVVQIYLRLQLDVVAILAEIKSKGPVHSPKMLEVKLAQLFELIEMSGADLAGVQFDLAPGIDLSHFKSGIEASPLHRFKSGMADLTPLPTIRKYHKKASDIMQSIPGPRGFLSALVSAKKRGLRVISITK